MMARLALGMDVSKGEMPARSSGIQCHRAAWSRARRRHRRAGAAANDAAGRRRSNVSRRNAWSPAARVGSQARREAIAGAAGLGEVVKSVREVAAVLVLRNQCLAGDGAIEGA